jgi:hypothetical protein
LPSRPPASILPTASGSYVNNSALTAIRSGKRWRSSQLWGRKEHGAVRVVLLTTGEVENLHPGTLFAFSPESAIYLTRFPRAACNPGVTKVGVAGPAPAMPAVRLGEYAISRLFVGGKPCRIFKMYGATRHWATPSAPAPSSSACSPSIINRWKRTAAWCSRPPARAIRHDWTRAYLVFAAWRDP